MRAAAAAYVNYVNTVTFLVPWLICQLNDCASTFEQKFVKCGGILVTATTLLNFIVSDGQWFF